MSEIIDVTARSADQIAIEICTIREQVATTAMVGACQIGKRLEELKSLVPFGEWGEFIKHRIGYSQRQCDNLMQLYREYGELGPKSQSIANLSPTAALKLLALPAGEREAFVEEHDAANLSVRKLEQKIRELTNCAESAEASDKAGRTLLAEATSQNGDLQQRLSTIDADYRGQLATVDKENDVLRAEVAQLKATAGAPSKISAEDAEKLRAEGRRQVEKELREQFQLAAAEDQEDIDKLTVKAEKQAAQIAELEKQLALAKATPTEVIQGMAKENDAKLAERDARIAELERQVEAAKAAKPDAAALLEKAEIQRQVTVVGEGYNVLLGFLLKAEGRGDDATAKAIRALVGKQIEVVRGKFGVVA